MTMMQRAARSFSYACLGLIILAGSASADKKLHALSLLGPVKYGPDFKRFDYVNPDAPKGGSVRLPAIGTFDSLNGIAYKGNVGAALNVLGATLIYDRLMSPSMDERSSAYCEIAEWVSHPDDYSSATFKIRDKARWHDGKPITPDDVIFSMEVQKRENPRLALYYKNVQKVEKTGENQVTFYFDEKNNRELPHIVGELVIVPKHFYEGSPARDPGKTWLEIPLGSGPYRIKSFEAGRYIAYERVADYWGADLPGNIGHNNVDEIRYEYFQDRVPAFESFKAGRIDFWDENSAKSWATEYNFPALNAGKVVKRDDVLLDNSVPMQGLIMNLRRDQFKDIRVRKAMNLMFNFEWMNKNLFFGQYKRTSSYFEKTDAQSAGIPTGKELEILETVRDQVPAELFTTEYKNPTNDPQSLVDRSHRRDALKLLDEAGWQITDGILRKDGQVFRIEFLLVSPELERIVAPYIQALQQVGIQSSLRIVDAAQYKRRLDEFDYDVIATGWRQSDSPGNEQRDYWGSDAAKSPGSRNRAGIQNPAIDKLIDRIIFAKDREELVAASRALDRVLLWNYYVVPQYYMANERFAYWDKYAAPKTLPTQSIGFPTVWWYDQAKADKIGTN
jgi:microcin C transport system substrate-binding protein